MAQLFDRDYKTIRKHINNALKEELKDEVVVAKFENTTLHGAIQGKTQTHMVEYYNLDMILSVGYRVKSNKGIIFRKWANKVLKEYTLKGYAVNQKRLEYLEKTIKLIDIANRINERLEENDAKEVLKVIGDYSKALDLLDYYDHRTLKKIEGNVDERKIQYNECIEAINKLKFNEQSSLFALERDKGLESIIGNIYQSFYATITDIEDTGLTIDNTALTVKGLEINDINFRGDFKFIITEATEIEWRNTNLDASELETGDNISIIFTGYIQESDSAKIEDVLRIQLLDDEK